MELISREDAIKDAESWVAVDDYEKHLQKKVVEWLKEFPSSELSTNLAEVGTDCISREQAIDAFNTNINELVVAGKENADSVLRYLNRVIDEIKQLPPIQPEIVRCKDCQYWNKGSCECPEHDVNCQDYYVGDIETEAEYFCGYAERREVTT